MPLYALTVYPYPRETDLNVLNTIAIVESEISTLNRASRKNWVHIYDQHLRF